MRARSCGLIYPGRSDIKSDTRQPRLELTPHQPRRILGRLTGPLVCDDQRQPSPTRQLTSGSLAEAALRRRCAATFSRVVQLLEQFRRDRFFDVSTNASSQLSA